MPSKQDLNRNRDLTAGWFLSGTGIEIGALHKPLDTPACAKVTFIDRMSAADLRVRCSGLKSSIGLIRHYRRWGDLERVDQASQDFIIASHFFEHCRTLLLP